jgi:PIN domain nuclease of toxin-antitoxin system
MAQNPNAFYAMDSSALLEFLQDEPEASIVEPLLPQSFISAVNWSEVVQKGIQYGRPVSGLREEMEEMGLRFLGFDLDDAERNAGLWALTRGAGLSLGDRACLALAEKFGLTAVTKEPRWLIPDLEINIQVVGNRQLSQRRGRRRGGSR